MEGRKTIILPKEQQRLAKLNYMAGGRALNEAELAEQHTLLKAYDYSIVRRSQALGILAQRGHTISWLQPFRESTRIRHALKAGHGHACLLHVFRTHYFKIGPI